MRLSELAGRELIDLHNGQKIGQLHDADLWIDTETGKIGYLILPENVRRFGFGKKQDEQSVPWEAVRKIGADMILLDLNHKQSDRK
ncbi:YlmC/YmxH family sporulation protein [Effusibacillus pohliae]|uniref:YlmC/YmxH family sporulation protein n=1 Tax=Effusibacillus pohliae TaxID=232270 RepID=UPI0003710DC8|nr:YlmC/YmxH family sporulation protein [Effusibacillus pohliae]